MENILSVYHNFLLCSSENIPLSETHIPTIKGPRKIYILLIYGNVFLILYFGTCQNQFLICSISTTLPASSADSIINSQIDSNPEPNENSAHEKFPTPGSAQLISGRLGGPVTSFISGVTSFVSGDGPAGANEPRQKRIGKREPGSQGRDRIEASTAGVIAKPSSFVFVVYVRQQ